jgi:lysozyme
MPAGGTTAPRRAAEQALFDVTPGAVPASTSNDNLVGPPDDDADPVTATRFDAAGATIVVLTDAASNVTDIVQLPNASPAAMAALLKQFPTVTTTLVAAVGAAVPPGEREVISDTPLKVPPVAKAPIFNRTPFIALGSKDGPKFPGNDVRQLQARLREIGYYTGPVTGFFDQATDEAARAFQADYFSPAEANGRVGPKTWAKLFPLIKAKKLAHKPAKKAHAKVTQAYLRLRRTPVHQDRLRVLKLEYVQNGKVVGSLDVYSGSPGHQKFRTAKDSRVGSLEPLPEGQWRVGTIMWKDGKDNYDGKIWNAGLGPVKIPLAFKAPGSTARGAIEIHIDWNRRKSPGTAGCLGLQNIHDYRILVGWLRDKPEPKRLFVNYRLGTCPKP